MNDTESSACSTLAEREEDATIRVMVVDDHEVVRRGLLTIFRTEPDITVVGEASGCVEALDRARELVPDVILMDIKMSDGDGFLAANEILKLFPNTRIIMLTGYESSSYVSDAIEIGVKGLITKNCTKRMVLNSIRLVMEGGSVWEGELLSDAFRSLRQLSEVEIKAPDTQAKTNLNSREIEVAKLVIDGMTNQTIALKLGMPIEAVKKTLRSIMNKLEASNRTQVAIKASRLGLDRTA